MVPSNHIYHLIPMILFIIFKFYLWPNGFHFIQIFFEGGWEYNHGSKVTLLHRVIGMICLKMTITHIF
jgi:hypothetical protein